MIKIHETRIPPDAVVLHLAGELLSYDENDDFRQSIKNVMTDGVKHVLADLTDLSYMNSAGLGALVAALTSLRRNRGDLTLSAPNEYVLHTLETTRLTQIFKVYSTLDEGMRKLKSAAAKK